MFENYYFFLIMPGKTVYYGHYLTESENFVIGMRKNFIKIKLFRSNIILSI